MTPGRLWPGLGFVGAYGGGGFGPSGREGIDIDGRATRPRRLILGSVLGHHSASCLVVVPVGRRCGAWGSGSINTGGRR